MTPVLLFYPRPAEDEVMSLTVLWVLRHTRYACKKVLLKDSLDTGCDVFGMTAFPSSITISPVPGAFRGVLYICHFELERDALPAVSQAGGTH